MGRDAPHPELDALRELIVLEDDAGRPVVYRAEREPHPATRRLMRTLGVTVEVVPVSARVESPAAANGARTYDGMLPVEEQKRRHQAFLDAQPMTVGCAVDGCDWPGFSGPAGEAREAAAAHRAEAHPSATRRIVTAAERRRQGQAAAAKRARALELSEREPVLREEAAVGEIAGSGSAVPPYGEPERAASSPSTGKRRRGVTGAYTRDEILAAFRRFHTENGRPPSQNDCSATGYMPHPQTVVRVLGSWAAAFEALGWERPTLGTRYRQSAAAPPRPRKWTRERILDALRAGAIDGRAPFRLDWRRTTAEHPTDLTVVKMFGTWERAVAEAVLELAYPHRKGSSADGGRDEREPKEPAVTAAETLGADGESPASPGDVAPVASPRPVAGTAEPGSRPELGALLGELADAVELAGSALRKIAEAVR